MDSRQLDQRTVTAVVDGCLAGKPLAEGCLLMCREMWDPEELDRIYEENRGRSYQRKLTLPFLVDTMLKVLGSEAKSLWGLVQDAGDRGELDASYQAVYGKLGRVPVAVSEALVRHSADVLEEVGGDVLEGSEIPESLSEFEVTLFDGKTNKRVPHRPKAVRGYLGQVLGSRLLVAFDLRRGLVRAIAASEDGHEGETNLLPRALDQVREQTVGRRRLHVVDRGFCDSVQFRRFRAEGDHVVMRYRRTIKFERDEGVSVREGQTGDGRRYWEEWGWLGGAERELYVRRIVLAKEKDPVVLVTSLLDANRYPAEDLVSLYKQRWTIETVFQHLSLVFDLKEVILCTPRGTVFQAALTMVLYNVLHVLKCFIASRWQVPARELSVRTIGEELREQMSEWRRAGGSVRRLQEDLPALGREGLRARLSELMGMQWKSRWIKQSTKYPRPPRPRRVYPPGGAVSLYRELKALREVRKRR